MNAEEKFVVPTTQFTELPESYTLKITLPGIGKEDADLSIDGRTLVLKTHAKHQNPAGFKQVAAEFERTNFALTADLPEMADLTTLACKLADGLMTVTLRKRIETQARKIEIG